MPFRTRLTPHQRCPCYGGKIIFAARVRGDRALLVADIYGCGAQGWTGEEFADQLEHKFTAARRRAGLGPRQPSDVHATSLDSVSRDPQRVPFAAYPLHPILDTLHLLMRLSGSP